MGLGNVYRERSGEPDAWRGFNTQAPISGQLCADKSNGSESEWVSGRFGKDCDNKYGCRGETKVAKSGERHLDGRKRRENFKSHTEM